MNNFVIITTPRTGSTYIRLWLNNHPHIRCHGEIFLRNYHAKDGFKCYCNNNVKRQFLYKVFCNKLFTRLPLNIILNNLVNKFFYSFYNIPTHSGPWTDLNTWNDYQLRNNLDMENSVGFKLMYPN